jgi:hypothetical protein
MISTPFKYDSESVYSFRYTMSTGVITPYIMAHPEHFNNYLKNQLECGSCHAKISGSQDAIVYWVLMSQLEGTYNDPVRHLYYDTSGFLLSVGECEEELTKGARAGLKPYMRNIKISEILK